MKEYVSWKKIVNEKRQISVQESTNTFYMDP